MGTLLIDRKDIELRRDGARLLILERGERTGSVPVSHLKRVVIQNRALLDTGVLAVLAEQGVGLVVINARRPGATASLPGRAHNDVTRRLAQYRHSLDERWRRRWSARLITRKLRAQRHFLRRALAHRADRRHALIKATRSLEQRLLALGGEPAPGLDTIRGIEGAAAAAYFNAFAQLFPPSLAFTGRNRRPPRDPVNACLSLGYTLLHADAVLALHAAGLDPLLGFYHDPAFGRESLACDLVEPLRPRIDEWVWSLFGARVLRAEQFSQDKGACLLNKAGRKRFYQHWEECAQTTRRALRRTAGLLARRLTDAKQGLTTTETQG